MRLGGCPPNCYASNNVTVISFVVVRQTIGMFVQSTISLVSGLAMLSDKLTNMAQAVSVVFRPRRGIVPIVIIFNVGNISENFVFVSKMLTPVTYGTAVMLISSRLTTLMSK